MSPFATTDDAIEYTPAAEGESALRIESVLEDAARMVEEVAPLLPPRKLYLSVPATDTSDALFVGPAFFSDPLNQRMLATNILDFPATGIVQVDDEKIRYGYIDVDLIEFQRLVRGYGDTTADVHDVGAEVIDRTYEHRAKRAELRVFDYLWKTGGNSLSSTSFIGSSVTYQDKGFMRGIVAETMGEYALSGSPAKIT